MKTIKASISIIFAAALLLMTPGCAQQEQDPTVTTAIETRTSKPMNVMSFNILYEWTYEKFIQVQETPEGELMFADAQLEERFPKLMALLEGEKIDIAGLQEVSPSWYSNITQQLPSQYSALRQASNNDTDTIGLPVIIYDNTKYELLESGYYYLAPDGPADPVLGWDAGLCRMLNWGVFREKETGVIFFFNATHYDHAGTQAREESAKLTIKKTSEIVEKIKETYGIREVPVLLTGDFNNRDTAPAIKTLKTYFADAKFSATGETTGVDLSTYFGFYYCADQANLKTGKVIDFIFHTPETVAVDTFKLIPTNTNLCPYGAFISDHCAIVANVTITNETIIR